MPSASADPAPDAWEFAREVLRGMAALRAAPVESGGPGDSRAEGRRTDDLAVPLGLSAWIVRAAIGLPDAYDVLLLVRASLLDFAALDRRSEPVPLRVADERQALRAMGAYLYGLVGRAAGRAGIVPSELAEQVIARFMAAA